MCARLNHVQLFVALWTVAHPASLSMGFSKQEYRTGLPCPSPEDFPNPGIELRSPSLWEDSLPFCIHVSIKWDSTCKDLVFTDDTTVFVFMVSYLCSVLSHLPELHIKPFLIGDHVWGVESTPPKRIWGARAEVRGHPLYDFFCIYEGKGAQRSRKTSLIPLNFLQGFQAKISVF